jgi:glycosyltransferase involved in cell wall biosynthesis
MKYKLGYKTLIFIPVYNCEKQLPRTLKKLNSINKNFDLLVIDNNSTDQTIKKALKVLRFFTRRVFLFKNKSNISLGGSTKIAFRFAREKSYHKLITLHGDDQVGFSSIDFFLDLKIPSDVYCIRGSRFMKGSNLINYPKIRHFGNLFFNYLYSICTGKKISDIGAGLVVYNRIFFQNNSFRFFPNDMTIDNFIIFYLIVKKFNFYFVPISWSETDQISNAKVIQQSIRLFKYLFSFIINKKFFLKKNLINNIDLKNFQKIY